MASKWWEAAPVVEQQAPQGRGGVFIADQGAIDDARRAEEANQRAKAAEARAAEAERRAAAEFARKERTAGVTGGIDTTEAEKTAAFLATRVAGGLQTLAQFRDTGPEIDATIAGWFGDTARNAFNSEERQRIEAAQLDVLDAALTLGTGAAYTKEQLEGYRRSYFPQLFDSPATIADKRRRLGLALEAARVKSGAAAPQIDKALQAAGFGKPSENNRRAIPGDEGTGRADSPQQDERRPFQGVDPNAITFDIDTGTGAFGSEIKADRLNPQQQAALDAFLKANVGNPNFGAESLGSFYKSIGVEVGSLPDNPAFYDAVRSGSAFDTTPDPTAADAELKRRAMEASFQEVPEGEDVGGYGFDKGLLLNLTDELRGGIGGLKSLATGNGFMSGYQRERDIERALQERSREQNGVVPELVGGLMTPAGLASKANIARDAAIMGGLAGFGEGEGFPDSVSKAATGSLLGYGVGKGIDVGAPIVANSAIGQRARKLLTPKSNVDAQQFAAAAERQELDYLAADIPGATKSKFITSVMKSTLGGIPLSEAAGKISTKAREARDRIAGNVGEVGDNVTAGQAVQRGMEAWEKQTGGRGGELYEAIPIKPDTLVDLSATRATLADLNNGITSNDELAALVRDPRMVQYQRALEKGDLSWKDIKSFRTYIGEKAGRPTLQQDTSKDSLDALYGALSQDIERAAAAHSPEAAKAFARANNYWRGRQARISDVMTKLVGKAGDKSPEATFSQIERWASAKGGDFSSLSRAIRSLPDDEANTVRATIIDRLGDANPGAQGAANENFSPDVFLTQWSKLSDRAKGVLFQGEHRKALDDLATVFEGSKFARGFDNTSKTSIGVNATALVGTGLVSLPTAVALSALQFGGGKLLASPRFARWIVALGKKPNPSAQLAHINQLTAIARSEPIIANDIFTIQQRLADAFAQPQSLRAAAEENDKVGDQKVSEGKRNDAQ